MRERKKNKSTNPSFKCVDVIEQINSFAGCKINEQILIHKSIKSHIRLLSVIIALFMSRRRLSIPPTQISKTQHNTKSTEIQSKSINSTKQRATKKITANMSRLIKGNLFPAIVLQFDRDLFCFSFFYRYSLSTHNTRILHTSISFSIGFTSISDAS